MTSSQSFVRPDVLNENKHSINDFLKESYSSAKAAISDGMNVIKDEFLGIYDKAGSYLHQMAMPINNFLKDVGQIEDEFLKEISKQSPTAQTRGGSIIPIEQAMLSPLEQNY